MKVDLEKRDVELLVQSLDHCLATCHDKAQHPERTCPDCDAAKALNDRLKAALKEMKQ